MSGIISIILCCVFAFLYIIVYKILTRIKECILIRTYYNYLWAMLVLISALVYPYSYLRNISFDFFYDEEIMREILKIALFCIIFAYFSGYKTVNKKYDFDFCIIFPLFEEILFRGVILLVLIKNGLLNNNYAIVISSVLFGIMHFQYFGFNRAAIRYVVIAVVGGYFLANIVLLTHSILPSVFLHMIFNVSAILFSKYRKSKYFKSNSIDSVN